MKIVLKNEDIGAGFKPTESGEIAVTENNPMYGHFGLTRNNNKKFHYGVDYSGEVGDRVYAMYTGVITRIYKSNSLGLTVQTKTQKRNGERWFVEYSHLDESKVKEGEWITEGTTIGLMGRSGNLQYTSYPTHVHIRAWRYVMKDGKQVKGFVPVYWE